MLDLEFELHLVEMRIIVVWKNEAGRKVKEVFLAKVGRKKDER